MREIPAILLICASLAMSQTQNLDDLLNQIFTQDNSGIGNQNQGPTPGPVQPPFQNQNQGTIPTPVIVQGGGGGFVDYNNPSPQIQQGGGSMGPYDPNKQQPTNTGFTQSGNGGGVYEPTPQHQQKPAPYPFPNQPTSNPCGLGECVPYYQCANGSIITDGEGLLDIRFGQEDNTNNEKHPCPGLFETCCTLRSPTIMVPPNTKINDGCGIRNADGVGFRITGDKDGEAQFGEFPWTVAILRQEQALDGQILNVYVCGGSIIDKGVILTAAHCVDKKDPHTLKIRAGEWDTQTKDEIFQHQDRLVENYVIHPEYYKGGLFNDIALLFLKEPVEIAEHVNTVCLPAQGDLFDGSRCFASGWGKDLFGKEGKYQVILKRVELPIVPRDVCIQKLKNTRLGKHFQLHQSFICAGGELGKDTCKGDGGSPLVCQVSQGRYAQVGIVSWGIGCGEHETPAVYVNVPLFRHWIDEQMQHRQIPNTGYHL